MAFLSAVLSLEVEWRRKKGLESSVVYFLSSRDMELADC